MPQSHNTDVLRTLLSDSVQWRKDQDFPFNDFSINTLWDEVYKMLGISKNARREEWREGGWLRYSFIRQDGASEKYHVDSDIDHGSAIVMHDEEKISDDPLKMFELTYVRGMYKTQESGCWK